MFLYVIAYCKAQYILAHGNHVPSPFTCQRIIITSFQCECDGPEFELSETHILMSRLSSNFKSFKTICIHIINNKDYNLEIQIRLIIQIKILTF